VRSISGTGSSSSSGSGVGLGVQAGVEAMVARSQHSLYQYC
jgi:hypothetical protein